MDRFCAKPLFVHRAITQPAIDTIHTYPDTLSGFLLTGETSSVLVLRVSFARWAPHVVMQEDRVAALKGEVSSLGRRAAPEPSIVAVPTLALHPQQLF